MSSKIKSITAAIAAALVATASHANIVTFDVSGVLTRDVRQWDPASYPFPELLGGTFGGTVSVDLNGAAWAFENRTFRSFAVSDVNVALRDVSSNVVHVIDTAPNRARYLGDGRFYLLLGESSGEDAVMKPDDLRLLFNISSMTRSGLDISSFEFGFSEVDVGPGRGDGSWVLNVASASMSSLSVTPTVPEPTSTALMALGLLGLGLAYRRRR